MTKNDPIDKLDEATEPESLAPSEPESPDIAEPVATNADAAEEAGAPEDANADEAASEGDSDDDSEPEAEPEPVADDNGNVLLIPLVAFSLEGIPQDHYFAAPDEVDRHVASGNFRLGTADELPAAPEDEA